MMIYNIYNYLSNNHNIHLNFLYHKFLFKKEIERI